MTRAELLAALQQATGPDRELDARIQKFLEGGLVGSRAAYVFPIHYTASIDAALTLVPHVTVHTERMQWTVDNQRSGHAAIFRNGSWHHGSGATPALAVCTAALKARGE